MPSEPHIDTETVETLLKTRHARMQAVADGEDMAAVELVARHLDGLTTPAESARARAIMAADPILAEAVALLADADGENKVSSLAAARQARSTRPAASRTWLVALAAVVVAGVGAALLLSKPSEGPSGGGGLQAGMGAGGDQITLTMRGDGGTKALTDGASPGDVVTIGVVTDGPGYAAVVRVDENGLATPVYEEGGGAALVSASGGELVLGGEVTVGSRCEWIVAAFDNTAFPTASLVEAVAAAPAPGEACVAPAPKLDFARSVIVRRLGK
ncbi:MAG: hypothetical protein KC635_17560 [Myxococcales bacterium]|nr:hypothetical protein [Myxococcales bacterium]MCB9733600.1 hypothetical protein [Deltaproteobacteria bacterium]